MRTSVAKSIDDEDSSMVEGIARKSITDSRLDSLIMPVREK